MANFFTDNTDLIQHFLALDIKRIVTLKECDFKPGDSHPEAPKSYSDALDNYRMALELLGKICAVEIAPRRLEVDMEGASFKDGEVSYAAGSVHARQLLSEAGFMGTMLPREYGGLSFPATVYMMMIEMVSRADPSLMTLFGYQDVGELIAENGSTIQCEEFLPKLATGEHIGAIVLTEPSAGSDLQSIKLKGEQSDDGNWTLNGVKHFISNGSGDVLMVLARTETGEKNPFALSLFVCPGGDRVVVNRIEEKMGLHGSPTCELLFNDAPAQLIGKRRVGLTKYIIESLNQARFSVAAQALGIAEAAYREALGYAQIRKQFGKLICDMPAVANLLFESRVAIESSRALLYEGVQWLDLKHQLKKQLKHIKEQKKRGDTIDDIEKNAIKDELQDVTQKVALFSTMIKYIVTEAANEACLKSQQVFGGMGYIRETGIEQLVRDVRITTIYEGTSQVQIAASLRFVMDDILENYFQDKSNKLDKMGPQGSDCKKLLSLLVETRKEFLSCLAFLRDKNDTHYSDASAKNLVDMYGSLVAGYLLVEAASREKTFSKSDSQDINKFHSFAVASRYIVHAHADAVSRSFKIKSDQYNDLKIGNLLVDNN